MADSKIYLGNVLVTEPQKQSDWKQADNKSVEYIKNKPQETTVVDSASTDEQYPTAKAVYTAIKNGGGGGGNSPFVPGDGENSAVLDNGLNHALGDSSVAEGNGAFALGEGSHSEGYVHWADLIDLAFSGEAESNVFVVIEDPEIESVYLQAGAILLYEKRFQMITSVGSPDSGSTIYFTTGGPLSDEDIVNGKGLKVFTFGAIGDYSHSEGSNARAFGHGSHAEGSLTRTTMLGESSHAEGNSTIANNGGAHAEGESTIANGYDSHVEGFGTEPIYTSIVFSSEGSTTYLIDDDPMDESFYLAGELFIHGIYPIIGYGEAVRQITWVELDQNFEKIVAFGTSESLSITGDDLYQASGLTIFGCHGSIGDYSHAEGNYTLSVGESSHAEGNNTLAIGSESHTEGNGTIAKGINSHAEGNTSIAYGPFSHAEGYGLAGGEASHAESYNYAVGEGSHAEGSNDDSNFPSFSATITPYSNELRLSESMPEELLPVGAFVELQGLGVFKVSSRLNDYSFSVDDLSIPIEIEVGVKYINRGAIGDFSHAEGINVLAKGDYSHAEGEHTYASGQGSHAEGGFTEANGDYSHSEGDSTAAYGFGSHAEGDTTISRGLYSHVEGSSTMTHGDFSHAEGGGHIEYFQGNFSGQADATLYTFDNGFSLTEEELPVGSIVLYSNVIPSIPRKVIERPDNFSFVVDETFDSANTISNSQIQVLSGMTYGSFAHTEGLQNNAVGNASHAEGSDNSALGLCSHVEGSHNIALNEFEHAQGVYNLSHTCDECDNEEDDTSLKTLYSIGNGSEDGGRKNAVEVMQNSDMYIEGVGGFDGQNTGQANSIQALFSNGFIKQFLLVTQEEYDDLDPKDPNTIYFIVDESPCDDCDCECECNIA